MTSSPQNTEKMAALGRMTRGLVHDFNNSLAAIMGYADFLTSDLDPDSEQHLFAENIKIAGLQLQNLIDQIRAISLEKNQGKDITLNLVEDIKNISVKLEESIPAHQKIIFNSDIGEAIISLPAHQSRTLFSNIILNAIQSLANNDGEISIHLSSELASEGDATDYDYISHVIPFEKDQSPVLRIDITDTGIGMDDVMINLALEPHFTTRTADTAHGMGLPITQGIIKYLGGGLTIQSTPDAGTCVTILLPVEKISAQAESPNKKNPVQNNILLIEDRDMVRHTIATMLVRCGHTVESTNSGLTALDILRENPDYFQMVISDYTMPEINGKNLIAEIRTDFPTLPIIIMSGDGGHLHELEMDKTQNHIFTLQKPVQAENLFNIMAKIAT